ncbi:MAG: tRNA epoxyqueuosine(34) reductase QueG [Planctomycetota bacterium]
MTTGPPTPPAAGGPAPPAPDGEERATHREARDALEREARALGFRRLGIAPAGRSPHADRFLAWLDAGRHGGMDYLARKVERRIDPRETLPGATSVIVVTLPYADEVPFPDEAEVERGRIARYARGRDYHRVMETRLKRLALRIREGERYRTWYTVDAGPLLERDWAERAGVGWLGKNGLIIDPEVGSWLFLGAIVTDRAYPVDAPIPDQCGTCTRCLDACPTGALIAARSVDARLCISYRTIEDPEPVPAAGGPDLHGWVYGCDICQEVCPWNSRPARVAPDILPDLEPRSLPDRLTELSRLDRPRFLEAFTGTSAMRAGHERLAASARAIALARGIEPPPPAAAP